VLLFIGRIQPLKAPDVLLRAAAELLARDPSLRARLVVAVVGGPSGSGLEHPEHLATLAERLGISDQFLGVDQIDVREDGSFEVLERVEGGTHQVSVCAGAPAVLGWATGNLPEPRNNPQIGMANMRTVMPALQKAKQVAIDANGLSYLSTNLPSQQRETRVEKDMAPEAIAKEIAEWIGAE
jgi:electron transfer flavoprotein beta subunit